MTSGRIVLWTLAVLAVCAMGSSALDARVYALCESNISMNLSQGFRIVPDESIDSSSGYLSQNVNIVNSRMKGTAMLHIMDVFDEDMKLFGSEYISEIWKMGIGIATSPGIGSSLLSSEENDNGERAILREMETYSDKSIGNWTATDYAGNNVTVSTIPTEGGILNMFGKTADICHWNIGEDKYAGLVSFFDRNTTQQIIGTLQVS